MLLIVIYALLYAGADRGLWPMIMHFHHNDWQAPNWVDMGVSSLLIPLTLACLLGAILRRELQESHPWPLLLAPFVVMTLTKYVGDAFYPPYTTELLTLLAAGAGQAASVWVGWYLWHRLSGNEYASAPRTEAPRPA